MVVIFPAGRTPPRADLVEVAGYQVGEPVQGGTRQRQAGGVDKAVRALAELMFFFTPNEGPSVRARPARLRTCREPHVAPLVQTVAVGELGHLRPQRFQLAAHRGVQAQPLADALTCTGPSASRTIARILR